jgi:uncharacterized protein (DUF305 family)
MLTKRAALLALIVVSAATGLGACGEDEPATSSADVAGNSTDRAFVAQMIPHHESAVEMAELAKRRAQHREIKALADAIIATQAAEIDQMKRLDERLEKAGVQPGELAVDHDAMGMDMDAGDLAASKPFDREFIDAMIAHHQGAIHMGRAERESGENPELLQLAEEIVDAQSKEIDEMNIWRVDWYGSISPSGGVPSEETPSEDTEHHGR